MDAAADLKQTHSQFIRDSLASDRNALRVAALKTLQQQAHNKYVADNGSSHGVVDYPIYRSLTKELAETEEGLAAGYQCPIMRGPDRYKQLVLEDLPTNSGGGYRVDPNMDTITAVFSSVLQLRNLTVAPPRIVK